MKLTGCHSSLKSVGLVLAAFLLASCQFITPAPGGAAGKAGSSSVPTIPQRAETRRVQMPDAPADPEPDPAPSDSAGVNRLMQLSRIWHLISLHHPAVAVRGIPIDSAFIRAVTLVRRAQDPALLEIAYSRFLAVLNDPLTRVEHDGPDDAEQPGTQTGGSATQDSQAARPNDTIVGEIAIERTADSILVISMPSATRYSERAKVALGEALKSLPQRIVLDMRTAYGMADADSLDSFVAETRLVEHLTPISFTRSTVRVRRVGGSRNIGGDWHYDDSWLGRDGMLVAADSAVARKVVVIANGNTVLPRAVLGLVATGVATLVGEGELNDDALVPSVRIALGNGLSVRIRTGEIAHVDGSAGVVADITVNGTASSEEDAATDNIARSAAHTALGTAFELLRTRRVVRTSRLPVIRAPAVLPGYYDADPYPFMGSRVLGAARIWSAMRARHAHRDFYDEDIDAAFERVIPKLESARSAREYARAMREFASAFDDAQVRLAGASIDSVRGLASTPFRVRWIDGKAIITDVVFDSATQALGIVRGLEVVAIDGFPVPAWIAEHRNTVSAPNDWNRLYQLMQSLPYGPEGNALLRVRDPSGRERQFDIARKTGFVPLLATVERPWQESSREMTSGIAYIDINRLTEQTVLPELAKHRSARAWILDLRGGIADSSRVAEQLLNAVRSVPIAVTARELHRYQSTPCLAATLREASQQCPDERELRARVSRGDTTGHFPGRLVALIDERTSGAMERLALALEATTNVTFIGSSSAGSPAETVHMELPGGLSIGIPAAELRRADGSQWQRIGITPVVDASITLRAFRMGADDVMERAHQWLVQQLDGPPRRRR